MKKIIESGFYNEITKECYDNTKPIYDIHWELTLNCCNDCSYCLYHNSKFVDDYLSLDKCDDIINCISQLPIINNLTLIGGEPTMHPHFLHILENISVLPNINGIILYTNGKFDHILNEVIDIIHKSNHKVTIFMSHHSTQTDPIWMTNLIQKLTDNNIKVYHMIMLELGQYENILHYIDMIKNIHPEIFCYHVIPIVPIEEQNYSKEEFALIKNTSSRYNGANAGNMSNNYIYYKILENNKIHTEIYNDNQVKYLDKFYHNFCSLNCYCYQYIRIMADGKFTSSCKWLESEKHEFTPDIVNQYLTSYRPCIYVNCFDRDDRRLMYKTAMPKLKNYYYNTYPIIDEK